MVMRKKIVSVALVMGMMLFTSLGSVPDTQAKDQVWVDVLTCPFGTSVHTVALAAGEIAKKDSQWFRITSSETPGYIFNLENLERNRELWPKTIVATSPACIQLAELKEAPFKTKLTGIKRILTFYPVIYFLVTLNPKIKTINDLKGKRMALGYKTQIDWGILPVRLLETAGILDEVKIQHVGTMPATEALLDGKTDVCAVSMIGDPITGVWQPQPQTISLIGSGKHLYYISWGKALVEKAVAKGFPITVNTMPNGTLRWQTQDIVGFNDPSLYAAKAELPDDLAYEFVKLHIKYYNKFKEYHKTGEVYSPKVFIQGLTKRNAHPGAIKAYEEAGFSIPE